MADMMQVIRKYDCTSNRSSLNCTEEETESIYSDLKEFFTNPVPLGLILGLALFVVGLVLLFMTAIYVLIQRIKKKGRRLTMSNPMYQTNEDVIPGRASNIEDVAAGNNSLENPLSRSDTETRGNTSSIVYQNDVEIEKQRHSEIDADYENVGKKRKI